MPISRRALPLALGLVFRALSLHAQPAELPPIFAPRPPTPIAPSPAPPSAESTPVAPRHSENVRRQMTESILAAAKMFDAPVSSMAVSASERDGVVMMERYIVKTTPGPRASAPRPAIEMNLLSRQLYHGAPVSAGLTANLFRKMFGSKELEVNLNLLHGSGPGLDHRREFDRLELEFNLRW